MNFFGIIISLKSKKLCVKCCVNGELAYGRKVLPAVRLLHPASTAFKLSFFMPLSTGKGGFFMQNKNSNLIFKNVKAMCAAALLAAIAVVISLICKSFTLTMSIRITFENLPLILSGYILGPIPGLLTGLCADLVSTSVSYGIGGINPILTVGAASVGFFAGMISRYIIPKKSTIQIFVTVFLSHFIGNIVIKSIGLYVYYKTPPVEIATRVMLYLCIAAIESVLITVILKSKGISKAIGDIKK